MGEQAYPIARKRALPQGALILNRKWSDDPKNPHITLTIHCKGGTVAGGLLTDDVKKTIKGCPEWKVKASTPDNNTLVLESDVIAANYKPTPLTPTLSFHDYPVNQIEDRILKQLQEELSKEPFTIGKSKDDKNALHASLYMTHDHVVLDLSTRHHDYDHKKELEEETMGGGNDAAKQPTALAIVRKLLPSLDGNLISHASSTGIHSIHVHNVSGMVIKLDIDAYNPQGVFAELKKQLEIMAETGVGSFSQKVMDEKAIPVAKAVDTDEVKMQLATLLAQAFPGEAQKEHRKNFLKDAASIIDKPPTKEPPARK